MQKEVLAKAIVLKNSNDLLKPKKESVPTKILDSAIYVDKKIFDPKSHSNNKIEEKLECQLKMYDELQEKYSNLSVDFAKLLDKYNKLQEMYHDVSILNIMYQKHSDVKSNDNNVQVNFF